MESKTERLVSLDLLRGLDIFLLTVVCGIVWAVHGVWTLPAGFMDQFEHPAWVGFSLHDLIMPLFIFMAGAALPLALDKRLEADGTAGWRYWRHVLSRVALLWFWGMISQGELLSFDLAKISFFNNTLQTIACGYLITAAVTRIPSAKVRLAVLFALAAGYFVLTHALGNMTPEGNFAVVYETKLLKLLYPEAYWSCHCITQIASWHYTWWPTIPMFGVMALAGFEATTIILSSRSGMRKTALLALVGVALLALGGIFVLLGDPCVKHIFTVSFTALAMGCAYLCFALCYWFADVRKFRRGYSLILLFGRYSLMAYLMNGIFCEWLRGFVRIFLCNGQADFAQGFARFLSEPVAALVCEVLLAVVLCTLLRLRANFAARR